MLNSSNLNPINIGRNAGLGYEQSRQATLGSAQHGFPQSTSALQGIFADASSSPAFSRTVCPLKSPRPSVPETLSSCRATCHLVCKKAAAMCVLVSQIQLPMQADGMKKLPPDSQASASTAAAAAAGHSAMSSTSDAHGTA